MLCGRKILLNWITMLDNIFLNLGQSTSSSSSDNLIWDETNFYWGKVTELLE